MTLVRIELHPSIKIKDTPLIFEGEFENIKLIDAIDKILKPFPEIHRICLENKEEKAGILYISKGSELASLGMLDTVIGEEENIEIKIVPILHGG